MTRRRQRRSPRGPNRGRRATSAATPEADRPQGPVEDADLGVEDEAPEDAEDDGRHHLRKEGDDAVELAAAHPRSSLRDQRREEEGEPDRGDRQDEEHQPVVPQRVPEEPVVGQALEVVQPDEGPVGREATPARERVVERLAVRPEHEDSVEQQRRRHERHDQAVAVVVHGRSRQQAPGGRTKRLWRPAAWRLPTTSRG